MILKLKKEFLIQFINSLIYCAKKICEEEGTQKQSPGPQQGHSDSERSMVGEGDSVSVVTLPTPPVLMTTTATVNSEQQH